MNQFGCINADAWLMLHPIHSTFTSVAMLLVYTCTYRHRSQLLMTPEKERREVAALTIQQQWRKRHAIRRQTKFQEAPEQGILDIQSALRGHITRRKTLSSQPSSQDTTRSLHTSEVGPGGGVEMSSDVSDSESSDTCVAVERIQAALRGHVARQMALHDLERYVRVHVHVCVTLYVCVHCV